MEMNDTEWARFLCETVYCLWFQIMCSAIRFYNDHAAELISFARKLLLAIQPKLQPMKETEIIFRRLFEACGKCGLSEILKELFKDMQTIRNLDVDKVTLSTYNESLVKCKEFEQS